MTGIDNFTHCLILEELTASLFRDILKRMCIISAFIHVYYLLYS